MKDNILRLLLCSTLIILIAGCATRPSRPSTPIKRVAIVSLVINGEALDQYDPVQTATKEKIINSKFATGLVNITETKLSSVMQVSPVAEFVGNADYQAIGVKPQAPYTLPHINGKSMVLLSAVRKEMVQGMLKPEAAKKLCASLHVDAVVLIYSEWFQERGGFVPTIRPYTDNFVTIWDSHGDLVFKERIGKMGQVQGIGMVNVSAEKLPQWIEIYKSFLDDLVLAMRKLPGAKPST